MLSSSLSPTVRHQHSPAFLVLAQPVERMSSFSLSVLSRTAPPSSTPSKPPPEYILGFHIPPLTSVPHLHLHAFELPFDDIRNKVEFRSTVRGDGRLGKKVGWFVGVGQVRLVS